MGSPFCIQNYNVTYFPFQPLYLPYISSEIYNLKFRFLNLEIALSAVWGFVYVKNYVSNHNREFTVLLYNSSPLFLLLFSNFRWQPEKGATLYPNRLSKRQISKNFIKGSVIKFFKSQENAYPDIVMSQFYLRNNLTAHSESH